MAAKLRLRQDRLARVCTAAGLSNQAELARTIGVSLPTVMRALNGTHGPGPVFIAALWAAFPDVPLEEFLELEPR